MLEIKFKQLLKIENLIFCDKSNINMWYKKITCNFFDNKMNNILCE